MFCQKAIERFHTGTPRYPEVPTVASSENRILDPDIEPAVRFKLRQNIKNALSRTLALLRIAPEPTFYLGARTFQITQLINLPRLNHPTLIRPAIISLRVDPVEIPVILGVYLLMDREDVVFNAFYCFFSVTHIIRSLRFYITRFI